MSANDKPAFGQWLPIESAPKDESPVLLACADWPHSMILGKAVPVKVGGYADGRWWIHGASWEPTHWMPLPPPPPAVAWAPE